nr:translation initiation factor IF-2-like [Aegilops tauschii subsp. strangulata]
MARRRLPLPLARPSLGRAPLAHRFRSHIAAGRAGPRSGPPRVEPGLAGPRAAAPVLRLLPQLPARLSSAARRTPPAARRTPPAARASMPDLAAPLLRSRRPAPATAPPISPSPPAPAPARSGPAPPGSGTSGRRRVVSGQPDPASARVHEEP